MKKLLTTIFLIVPILCSATVGKIGINIVAGLAVTELQQLYFSNVSVIGAATIVMTPSGERTTTIGDAQFKDVYSAPAQFSVSGANGSAYKVSFGGAVTLTNGKYSLQATDFKSSLQNNLGVLDANGKGSFYVGCTVTIPAGISSGAYNGSYDVTCAYE